jgi:hypothetical protein
MKSVGKDWAICTSEIDDDLKDRIRYAYLQGWPLTKQDTRARIQEDTDQLGGFTDDSSAMRYGCMSLDEVIPHDYYRYHTKQTDRSTGLFFLTYPELTTAASLAEYLTRGGVERSARVTILRAKDIGLGGNGDGHALEQHWLEQEYSLYLPLKNTFINWFLVGQEAQEDSRRDTIINNLTETIKHESIRLVNIGGKGPAISYEAAHCMATDLFSKGRTSAEDCRDLARKHMPFDRKSISTDPMTGRMQRIKKKGFLAGTLQNIRLNPPPCCR